MERKASAAYELGAESGLRHPRAYPALPLHSPCPWATYLGFPNCKAFFGVKQVKMVTRDTYLAAVGAHHQIMPLKGSECRAQRERSPPNLDISVVLLRFVLKLLIRSLERQDVNSLKLGNKTRICKAVMWFIIEVVRGTRAS